MNEEKSILSEMAKVITERDDLRVEVERLRALLNEERATQVQLAREELPYDMARALGITTDPDRMIETCRNYSEQYKLVCESRQAALLREQDLRRALYVGTHDEALATIAKLVQERDKAIADRDMHASRAENFRDQSDSKDCTISNLRSILGHPNLNIEEAARRVREDRDIARIKVRTQASMIEEALKTRDEALVGERGGHE